MIKRVIGFVLLAIAGINILGIISAVIRGIKLPYPKMYYPLLIGLIFLGVRLAKKKEKN